MQHLTEGIEWLRATFLLSPGLLRAAGAELAVILLACPVAMALRRASAQHTDLLVDRIDPRLRNPRLMRALRPLVMPAIWWGLLILAHGILTALKQRTGLLGIAASLLLAWIIIRATSALVRDVFLSRAIAAAIWLIVALEILGLLAATEKALDGFALTIGSLRLSLLGLIEAAALLAILLWAAFAMSRIVQVRVSRVAALSPSIRVLIANLSKIILVVLAIVIALNTIGIDLTALAVFSGAIGVGVGFGLQKIVSNLISGVILLLDESIKPGDVIETEDTFGWITSLGARYVSIRSRDGKEYLIPNEDLITHRVINWSYSSRLVRLDIPFGVGYGSDLRLVRELATAAAGATRRVLHEPAALCHVTGFGDNGVNMLLRIWIDDPINGVTNVKSDIFLVLYEKLNAAGVELPFPQREIRVRDAAAAAPFTAPPLADTPAP